MENKKSLRLLLAVCLALITVVFVHAGPNDYDNEQTSQSTVDENEQINQDSDTTEKQIPEAYGNSSYYNGTYLSLLAQNHTTQFSTLLGFGEYAIPIEDGGFGWATDLIIDMNLVLASGSLSLTANPRYVLTYGMIPGTAEKNEFQLHRLHGSVFVSDWILVQIGLLNWDQGPRSQFNPFSWFKSFQPFAAVPYDPESRLGIAVHTPWMRLYYAYDPDFANLMGGISLNIYPHDLFSGGLIAERIAANSNRAGGYAVSFQESAAVSFMETASFALYFDDSFSMTAPELDVAASFMLKNFRMLAGFYWNGRRASMLPDSEMPDPFGYLSSEYYAYCDMSYRSEMFFMTLKGYANLVDSSMLFVPSFVFVSEESNIDLRISADFPLVFGTEGTEMRRFMPSSFYAILKIVVSINVDRL